MTTLAQLTCFFISCLSAVSLAQEIAPENPQDTIYRESLATLKGTPDATEIENALAALAENATKGHPASELWLGQSFYLGSKVIPKDHKRAFPYPKAAALRNHPWAMNAFASMHEYGQGTEKDTGLALNWYRLAATSGHPRAMANLGRILISRPANSRDHIEGCAWLYLSRELKDGVGSRTLEQIEAGIPAGNVRRIEDLLNELRKRIQTTNPAQPAATQE